MFQEEMCHLGIGVRAEFAGWLAAEKAYLKSLSKEPEQETLQMEYYQKLINLQDTEERLATVLGIAAPNLAANAPYAELTKATRRLETQRRHALELREKAMMAVQVLEVRLDIVTQWVAGGAEWEAAAVLVSRRRYQRALDKLEGLIISWMFELTKVNMSGTGPAGAVQGGEGGANLLQHSCWCTRGTAEPWALPSGCLAMDKHFDLLRADEELIHLDMEIKRLVTHMRDEDLFLQWKEDVVHVGGDPALAFPVSDGARTLQGCPYGPPGMAKQEARVHGLPGAGRQHLDGTGLLPRRTRKGRRLIRTSKIMAASFTGVPWHAAIESALLIPAPCGAGAQLAR
ncbi:hypothetical protein C8J57DRAFT_1231821 [Mycena rebaudengoi]|nr:hypothetical protein C8J57DRAFT_1231821 [Mycena rebaudengoi]